MPTILAKVPFWLWHVLGLVFIALSIPGFLDYPHSKSREQALSQPAPELIDLEDFEPSQHVGVLNEINVFAQIHPDHQFSLPNADDSGRGLSFVPLFSAVAGPKETSVKYLLILPETNGYEGWLGKNAVGAARMGELIEINGQQLDEHPLLPEMMTALQNAGLEPVAQMAVFQPFEWNRLVSLATPSRQTFGNPFILALAGAWMAMFGTIVWSRLKKLKQSLTRRIGEIEERANRDDEVNRSQLHRKSRQITTEELEKNKEIAEKAAAAIAQAK